jgi:hypothetical protein
MEADPKLISGNEFCVQPEALDAGWTLISHLGSRVQRVFSGTNWTQKALRLKHLSRVSTLSNACRRLTRSAIRRPASQNRQAPINMCRMNGGRRLNRLVSAALTEPPIRSRSPPANLPTV